MNKQPSRIFQYFGIFLLSLFISYLVFTFADRDREIEQAAVIKQVAVIEQTADIDIVGEWQSKPTLGQLGLGQSSYTFNADGSYSSKLDMISFCEEQYGQDCEYFWMISDGTYAVKNGVITLTAKEDKTVKLGKGQSKPDMRIDTDYNPRSNQYMVKLDAGNLVLTGIKNDESVIYKPFVATAKDEEAPSVDARDAEQAMDIVGEWQSEPRIWISSYVQSGYTFRADGTYSSKLDMISTCDVPEQNCEYHWMFIDGKYAVKNGVITLYVKEVRTEILRKGKNKPDIHIAPDRPHSGDEYIAKLDAGKLFMTNIKSDELVIFKSINND